MSHINQVFLILYARARRELGESQIGISWERAIFKLSITLVPPLLTVMFLLAVLSGPVSRRVMQVGAGIAGLAMFLFVRAKFAHYRAAPPPLAAAESITEARFISRFRLFAFGSFAGTLLVAILHGILRN